MDNARGVFDEMCTRDVVSWTSLIKGYANARELDIARGLFDEMPARNVVSWAVMIAGYVNGEMFTSSLRLFNVMLSEGREIPNEAVLVCALTACAHLGALDQGKWIHAYIDKMKLPVSSNIATALINMYSKCGRIESAKQVFYSSWTRDVMTWTSMISGLALHGLGNDAVQAFNQMVACGIRPDSITLLGILNACSHSGLVEEGQAIFYDMIRLWRVKPQIEHYGCLIDLLGRAGQIEKALAIVIKMPIAPDIVIWRALLSACRTHGNIQLSERIIDHIARLDLGSQGGGHVLLSNLYASVGKWDDLSRLRSKMGEECKGSSPGCSWIEVDGVVHEFLAADRLHPQIEAIRSKLVEVVREVSKKGGYIANTKNVLFDLSDEDREQAIYWHSEKLAVAFGLMSLQEGSSIRIVKNLRICEDCHAAMRAVSLVYGREIVVRDRARFHTFREGKCSCNEYW